MSELEQIPVTVRERAGKGAARATRLKGQVPGVVYGAKLPPKLIAIDPKRLNIEVRKPGFFTRLFYLNIDGEIDRVMCRDVQRHPVTERALHVDFMRVAAGATVHVGVPLRFINELASPGLKRGGVLNIVQHEIEVMGQPEAIPVSIDIDLTGTEIGDSIHLHHLTLPPDVRSFITDRDFTVATIVAPSGLKSDDEGASGAAAA
ncbi:MAG: 50S ribosomal protein L25/general stress protein Ctc [Alphaproteobacteria bacterium]|nr:50S ribosomal protein L25/general stress protein Ctc [Alphaproteobacteria bacterium]